MTLGEFLKAWRENRAVFFGYEPISLTPIKDGIVALLIALALIGGTLAANPRAALNAVWQCQFGNTEVALASITRVETAVALPYIGEIVRVEVSSRAFVAPRVVHYYTFSPSGAQAQQLWRELVSFIGYSHLAPSERAQVPMRFNPLTPSTMCLYTPHIVAFTPFILWGVVIAIALIRALIKTAQLVKLIKKLFFA